MKNISIFQVVLIGAFIAITIGAVIFFALDRPNSGSGRGGEVVWWGSLPKARLNQFLEDFNANSGQNFTLVYESKNPETLESELVEALASGRGPDLVLLSHEQIFRQAERLFAVPYESFPRRAYEEQFIEAARLWLTTGGLLGLPLGVDPLVLYYNRDRLSAAGLTRPPTTWTEFLPVARNFFEGDNRGNIFRSAIALGEFSNIPQAKDIISLLLLQSGNPIYAVRDGTWRSVFSENPGFPTTPAFLAINFFTQFADAARATYSWNSVMPPADEAFARGTTAFYLGRASEFGNLSARNPHLNFDVALMPQRTTSESFTFGRLYGLGVLRTSKNLPAAVAAAGLLASRPSAEALAPIFNFLPARRDLLNPSSASSAESIFFRSALIARGWFDFNPEATEQIFRRLVTAAKTSEQSLTAAINQANNDFNRLLGQ